MRTLIIVAALVAAVVLLIAPAALADGRGPTITFFSGPGISGWSIGPAHPSSGPRWGGPGACGPQPMWLRPPQPQPWGFGQDRQSLEEQNRLLRREVDERDRLRRAIEENARLRRLLGLY